MITAHLPAGYLLSRGLKPAPYVVTACLVGSIFPDLDLFWYEFIDHHAVHHHRYWVHVPLFWAMVLVVALPIVNRFAPQLFRATIAFVCAIFLHIMLDSIAGGIMWSWPFDDTMTYLFKVPRREGFWLWSFILHPIFLLEIAIWIAAAFAFVFWKQVAPKGHPRWLKE